MTSSVACCAGSNPGLCSDTWDHCGRGGGNRGDPAVRFAGRRIRVTPPCDARHMPATPRTQPPAALRLVDASPARSRPHRPAGATSRSKGGSDGSGPDASGQFVLAVRALAMAARSLGLCAPSFQSPPRSDGLDRSIQRVPSGDCVVAVRVRGRPFGAVVADAIEGIVVCNDLSAGAAGPVRDELWREAELVVESMGSVARHSGPPANSTTRVAPSATADVQHAAPVEPHQPFEEAA